MFNKFFHRSSQSSQMKDEQKEVTVQSDYHDSADSSTSSTYMLKKRHPGCTGMFWRSDPTGQTKCHKTSENWPRDNALVRGIPITTNTNELWLLVSHVQQHNTTQWITAPVGAALPFEYDNHYYLEKME